MTLSEILISIVVGFLVGVPASFLAAILYDAYKRHGFLKKTFFTVALGITAPLGSVTVPVILGKLR
jgi:uncharacterized membrane protein YeaQ/YmgE (transglycosylase-associated protein family)